MSHSVADDSYSAALLRWIQREIPSSGMAWTLFVIGTALLQGYIPAWYPQWFVAETGQITIDPFGPFTALAVVGLLLGWRWMWHITLFWFLIGGIGYLPTIQRLLDPASSFVNEHAFGWSLLLGLHVLGFVALFAPSMRERFSADEPGEA